MRIAILCPGPSLSRYPGPTGFNLVIGVNRVAVAHTVDVWACGDYPLIEQERTRVLGTPTLLTAAASSAFLRDHSPLRDWPHKTIEFEQLHGFCDRGWQWEMFSATAALVFAAWVGATSIDCYGMDWRGTLDFDGVAAGGNRSPERWELERAICINRLFPWLERRGVTVVRN